MTHPTTPKMIDADKLKKWVVEKHNSHMTPLYCQDLLHEISKGTFSPDRERGESDRLVLSENERCLLRQWYNAVKDLNPKYLDNRDHALLEKITSASHSGDAFMEAVRELVDACLDTIATGVPVGHLDSATDKMRALLPATEVPRE